MTDRELLELAAKAAGHKIIGWETQCGVEVAILDDLTRWQPLYENEATDCDGDVFRLAVRVGIDVCGDSAGNACAWCPPISDFMSEPGGSDPCAATRRAIIRAAAEIGRGMA